MIFMRMGKEDCFDFFIFQKRRVRRDDIYPRRIKAAKGDTYIGNNPTPVMGRPIAIGIKVHSNFFAPAKRQKNKFFFIAH